MSHFRRNFGRFTSSSASEHYQRQLTAPVNKWKKQWVTPIGLAPESSYKICKWVKQKEKAKLTGAIEVDDNTPVPEEGEGDEDEDGGEDQDQDMEEDDQDQNEDDGDEGEGEGENEDEEDVKATTTAAQTPAPTVTVDTADSTTQTQTQPEPISTTAKEGEEFSTKPTDAAVDAQEEEVIPPPTTGEKEKESTPAPEKKEEEENHESTIPTHQTIPSNATEIHPVGPSATESGLGESSTEPLMEMETRPAEDITEKMDIEEEPKEKEKVEEEDKGLVHGEMDAPTRALEVENTEVPKEVEKE
ncbi:hypothetical protein I204_05625 [Kwoniella mangroviensis CBS 8886]|uniref:uncharacterized protein n=1 Tax=Kwoniella mangroviensis CBS 8507 TaxID=1296122 RepID=UPI00080D0012|nr:uncharacterized protein I203_06997 [Kwoniella mangroviensis CBS 8507]OCF64040.1 hypothetical protein I203_06997 [Kwoniella mangroviensis CBS 8507]OCF73781.1 hypothetical protein I204_05625 [Kwoniella mangroviensis CBS 8886]